MFNKDLITGIIVKKIFTFLLMLTFIAQSTNAFPTAAFSYQDHLRARSSKNTRTVDDIKNAEIIATALWQDGEEEDRDPQEIKNQQNSPEEEYAEEFFFEALSAQQRGQYELAKVYLRDIIQNVRSNRIRAIALCELAILNFNMDDLETAEQCARKAADIYPEVEDAFHIIAMLSGHKLRRQYGVQDRVSEHDLRIFEENALRVLAADQGRTDEVNIQALRLFEMQVVPVFSYAKIDILGGKKTVLKDARTAEEKADEFLSRTCRQLGILPSDVRNAVYELSYNLLKHADGGIITFRKVYSNGRICGIEIVALDKGPGMDDVEEAKRQALQSFGSGRLFKTLAGSAFAQEGEVIFKTNEGGATKTFVYDNQTNMFLPNRYDEERLERGTRVKMAIFKEQTHGSGPREQAEEAFKELYEFLHKKYPTVRDDARMVIEATHKILDWRKAHFGPRDNVTLRISNSKKALAYPVLYIDLPALGIKFPAKFTQTGEIALSDEYHELLRKREALMEKRVATEDPVVSQSLDAEIKQVEDRMDPILLKTFLKHTDFPAEKLEFLLSLNEVLKEAGYKVGITRADIHSKILTLYWASADGSYLFSRVFMPDRLEVFVNNILYYRYLASRPARGRSFEFGAQVSGMRKLDRFARIIGILRKSRDSAIAEDATDAEVVEYCLNYLDKKGLVTKRADTNGTIIISISDHAVEHPDETTRRISLALKKYVISPEDGVKAINFEGTNKWKTPIWKIVGFEKELEDRQTLMHEQVEISYRKIGLSWVSAHNAAVRELGRGTMIDKAQLNAQRQLVVEIGADIAGKRDLAPSEMAKTMLGATGPQDTKDSLFLVYSPLASESEATSKLITGIAKAMSLEESVSLVVLTYQTSQQKKEVVRVYDALDKETRKKVMYKHIDNAKKVMVHIKNDGYYSVKYLRTNDEEPFRSKGIEDILLPDISDEAVTEGFEKQFREEARNLLQT